MVAQAASGDGYGGNIPTWTEETFSNYFTESVRAMVQAAAERTSIFATITGDALIITPYITQSSAPNI